MACARAGVVTHLPVLPRRTPALASTPVRIGPSRLFPRVHSTKAAKKPTQGQWLADVTKKNAYRPTLPQGEYQVTEAGIRAHMGRVFTTTGVSIGTALSGASVLVFAAPAFVQAAGMGLVVGGCITGLGSIFAFVASKYTVETYRDPKQEDAICHRAANSLGRQLAFSGLVASEALVLAPLLAIYQPASIVAVAAGTLAAMGGAVGFAAVRPVGSMEHWQPVLCGGLVGLLGLGLAAIFVPGLHVLESFGGIALFTALTAHDTQHAVVLYRDQKPDHLESAMDLLLNFVNMFMRLLHLSGVRKD